MSTISHHSTATQVLAASELWIAAFNRGDVEACVSAYQPDATLWARPMGQFRGREAIHGFWQPFIASGAGELEYRNVRIQVVSENEALLAADWSMNVGQGYISMERWVCDADSNWRIADDDFTVTVRR